MDIYITKNMLLEEYMASDPPPTDEEIKSFIKGMTWLEEALSDPEETEEALNDYMPADMETRNLRKELAGVRDLMAEVEQLRSANQGLNNIIENYYTLSASEKRQMRMNHEIQLIREEMARISADRDFWRSRAARLELERQKKE